MIHIDALSKRYGQTRAVDDLTLTIPSSSVTAVLGLNGAGKTTLLRLIAGLEHPDSGAVTVCGRSLRAESDPMRLLGTHFDPGSMDPRHTARRHLQWLAVLGGIETERVPAVLDKVGLSSLAGRRIATLSMGARQRLAIGSALLGDPQVVVLDEPVNGLDVPGIVWLRNLLRGMASTGKTVVVASHLLAEVVLTADRVLMLADGRLVKSGALMEIVPAGADPREYLERELTIPLAVRS